MGHLTARPAPARARSSRSVPLLGLTGLVALGGAVGALARWLLESAFAAEPGEWPWATFWINLCGALLLGVLLEWLLHAGPDHGWRRAVRLGVGTGLIGGFTTYSTFVLEAVSLAQDGRAIPGVAYALVSVVLGVVAAGAGTGLAVTSRRWIGRRRGEGS
ncbi:fluoride efflux transporter CrcB [Promicromonospora soli]